MIKKTIIKTKLNAFPYNKSKHNGIVIVCKNCGHEFEETAEGYYEPLEYEEDMYDRICLYCLKQEGYFS